MLQAKDNRKNPKPKDPLAQLVEHNTFNVGVMGSNPMRVTRKQIFKEERKRILRYVNSFFFVYYTDIQRNIYFSTLGYLEVNIIV